MKYQITYFYLATGMEGKADIQDYGIWEGDTPEEAIEKAVIDEYPEDVVYGRDNKDSNTDVVGSVLLSIPIAK